MLAWGLWAAGLLAGLVRGALGAARAEDRHPLAVVGGAVAAVGDTPELLGWIGLATAAVAAVAAMSAEVGYECINGASLRRRGPSSHCVRPRSCCWAR